MLNDETFGSTTNITAGLPSFFQHHGTTVLDELVAEFDILEENNEADNFNDETFDNLEEYAPDEVMNEYFSSGNSVDIDDEFIGIFENKIRKNL